MYKGIIRAIESIENDEMTKTILMNLVQQARIERDLLEAQYAIVGNPKATILFSMEGFIFYKTPWGNKGQQIVYGFAYKNESNEWRRHNQFTDTIQEAMALYLQIKTFGTDRITFADLLRPLSRDEKHDRIR